MGGRGGADWGMSSRRTRRCKSNRKVGLEDDKCAAGVCGGERGRSSMIVVVVVSSNSSSGSSSSGTGSEGRVNRRRRKEGGT